MTKRVFNGFHLRALPCALLFALFCAFLPAGRAAAADAAPAAAAAEDMAETLSMADKNAAPITADMLLDGEYSVRVDSSSSMFRVASCRLRVSGGEMTARLYMNSEAYSHMFPGGADEAAALPLGDTVSLAEDETGLYFDLPVSSLDAPYICAAYSAKKALWYPRTLMFRSDTLPLSAFRPEDLVTAGSLGLADGEYTLAVSLTGAGKIGVQSPAVLTVNGGACTAHILFSTKKIGYLLQNDTRYEPVSTEDGAAFAVPVPVFDRKIPIVLNSTAMKPAADVPCSILFSSEHLEKKAQRRGSFTPRYAEGFSVTEEENGCTRIDVLGHETYLLVPEGCQAPEGLDPEVIVLRPPFHSLYVAASNTMSMLDALGALDQVRLCALAGDSWYVKGAKEAMERGDILYAGKYSQPDFELLIRENCDLAVENMMILHAPKTGELLKQLGIPVFLDRSSSEPHPLGRLEWIRLYGLLTGREREAEEIFARQAALVEGLSLPEAGGKTAVFFSLNADGAVTVRGSRDYLVRCIELAGGRYAFSDMEGQETSAQVRLTMESFYEGAKDADVLIYNAAIQDSPQTLAELLDLQPLLSDFRAVGEGRVYCTEKSLYQSADAIGTFIRDAWLALSGAEEGMTFLFRLR